jgi:histone H3/H4
MSTEKKPDLVVVSKAKSHVKATTGMSVGMDALAKLSEKVAVELAKAAEKAKADGRKVIKDRDIE